MNSKNLTQVALMVTLIIVLGAIPGIPIGIIPVPIVLQNFGIILAGLLLGPKRGTMAVAIFLLLAAIGLPVLSGFRGGLAIVLGPTGGYLLAWLFTPLLIGGLIQFGANKFHRPLNFGWSLLITLIISIIFIYLVAVTWLSIQSHIPFFTALAANSLFIPGDVIKAIIAVIIAKRLNHTLRLNPNLS
ncbi:biotin transporter BioY [Lactobacillaceae bacterium Scapto_B20]